LGAMAAVAGLAPAMPGLKGRLLELLCIHGQMVRRGRMETRGCCSQAGINPVKSSPSTLCRTGARGQTVVPKGWPALGLRSPQ